MGLTTDIGLVYLLMAIVAANVLYDGLKAIGIAIANKIDEVKNGNAKREVNA